VPRGTAGASDAHQELPEGVVELGDVSEHAHPRMLRMAGPASPHSAGELSGLYGIAPLPAGRPLREQPYNLISMAERAQEFRTPREVESARPLLDSTCSIPLSEFNGLVGRYTFKEADWVRCQLEEKGSVCRQLHGHSWVAKRKDGIESYIGKYCAHGHFGADSNFAAEASRMRRELLIDSLVERLATRLSDPGFRSRLESANVLLGVLRDRVRSFRELWPAALLLRLREMSKTGNRNVAIEFLYVERDEKGHETRQWQP